MSENEEPENLDHECPDCGNAVDGRWNYCTACGRVLRYPCCGNREIAPTDKKCGECGAPLPWHKEGKDVPSA